MLYFSLFIFAVLPSFIWLLYYFKKDVHPEPKHLITFVFFGGGVLAIIGYLFQYISIPFFFVLLKDFPSLEFYFRSFVLVALSEETFKYFAFFFTIRKHRELDEPIDIIVYMITAGLGFAALENFLILSSTEFTAIEMVKVSAFRFLSATFLHALASGVLGVFIVYAFRHLKKWLILVGLIVATLLHGFYNLIAMEILNNPLQTIILLFFFLFSIFLFLSFKIKKIKKMKSVCLLR